MVTAFPVSGFLARCLMVVARIFTVILSLVLLALPFFRANYQAISDGIYGASSPLMDSRLLEIILNPWASAVLALGMIGFIYVRQTAITRDRRQMCDLVYLTVVAAAILTYQVLLYGPVLQSAPI